MDAAQQANNAAFAQQQAAHAKANAKANDVIDDGAWYETTTAKVVGGVVLGAVVAAAGYYAYKHFCGNTAGAAAPTDIPVGDLTV